MFYLADKARDYRGTELDNEDTYCWRSYIGPHLDVSRPEFGELVMLPRRSMGRKAVVHVALPD